MDLEEKKNLFFHYSKSGQVEQAHFRNDGFLRTLFVLFAINTDTELTYQDQVIIVVLVSFDEVYSASWLVVFSVHNFVWSQHGVIPFRPCSGSRVRLVSIVSARCFLICDPRNNCFCQIKPRASSSPDFNLPAILWNLFRVTRCRPPGCCRCTLSKCTFVADRIRAHFQGERTH